MAKHRDELEVDVLEACPVGDFVNLQERERHWIAVARERSAPGVILNLSDGGYGGMGGRALSDAHRQAISEGLRAHAATAAPREVSAESRARMSRSHTGVPLTPQTRATMSDGRRGGANHPLYGTTRAASTRELMRLAVLGTTRSLQSLEKQRATYAARSPEARTLESQRKRDAAAARTPEQREQIRLKIAARAALRTPVARTVASATPPEFATTHRKQRDQSARARAPYQLERRRDENDLLIWQKLTSNSGCRRRCPGSDIKSWENGSPRRSCSMRVFTGLTLPTRSSDRRRRLTHPRRCQQHEEAVLTFIAAQVHPRQVVLVGLFDIVFDPRHRRRVPLVGEQPIPAGQGQHRNKHYGDDRQAQVASTILRLPLLLGFLPPVLLVVARS